MKTTVLAVSALLAHAVSSALDSAPPPPQSLPVSTLSSIVHNLPGMDQDDAALQSSMQYAEAAGRAAPLPTMRFQEARTDAAEDPDPADADADAEGGGNTAPPMTDDDIARLKAQGASDTELSIEQAKRKIVEDKLNTAKETMATEEQKEQADAEEQAKNEEANPEKNENDQRMDDAIQEAAAKEKQNIQSDEEKNEKKEVVLKQVKEEAELEAEKESANFADVSPEEIMKADQAERQQQYLAAMTPGAIAAAEMELSSVFSGVIGSLLTNMLTQEPELVREHMGLASKK